MSIRLRRVDGHLIACCAARTIAKPGDIYLDDEVHHALGAKFAADFGLVPRDDPRHTPLREAEESNNANRDWWDKEYGAPTPHAEEGER